MSKTVFDLFKVKTKLFERLFILFKFQIQIFSQAQPLKSLNFKKIGLILGLQENCSEALRGQVENQNFTAKFWIRCPITVEYNMTFVLTFSKITPPYIGRG